MVCSLLLLTTSASDAPRWKFNQPSADKRGRPWASFTTIGLDLAKHVFHVVGSDARGKVLFRKVLRRGQVRRYFANVPACVRGNKNDYNDARAIGEAAGRSDIRTVSVKTVEQQDVQALSRLRAARVELIRLCGALPSRVNPTS